MSALNGVQSDILILQNIKCQTLEIKDDKNLGKKLDFKDITFPFKIRDIHKIEKKNQSALGFLVMKIKKNIQFINQKYSAKRNMLIYY